MNSCPVEPPSPSKPYRVRVSKNIVYGAGAVGASAEPRLRDLKLDLYQPLLPAAGQKLPVLILAFGGAFHRGTKEDDAFGEAPHRNHSVSWYCHEFARRGYAACSIDYRLVPEDPQPGATRVVSSPKHIPRSRVDTVRSIMGLPAASDDLLWRGVEAASDDMAMAVRYIKAHAEQWNIDPGKVAIGGFSAGARTALNVALGEREPVAAVVALSGYMHAADLESHIALGSDFPALFLVSAENDLDYVASETPSMARRLRELGLDCEYLYVPGASHFYPASAPALHESRGMTTVEDAMAAFLERALAR